MVYFANLAIPFIVDPLRAWNMFGGPLISQANGKNEVVELPFAPTFRIVGVDNRGPHLEIMKLFNEDRNEVNAGCHFKAVGLERNL